jgi:hypothetical protein
LRHGEAKNESLFEDEHGMKRLLAVAGLSAALAMAGCSQPDDGTPPPADQAGPATEAGAAAVASDAPAAPGVDAAAEPAAPGAAEFAVIYPGGTPKAAATSLQGPAGAGWSVEFVTPATPDQVVAFYRQRAEAAGLKSINTLSRDEVRGYAAGDGASGAGKLVNVVATPLEDGQTDVLLQWSNGG